MTCAVFAGLLLALSPLPRPTQSGSHATLEVTGTPAGALIELRAPDSDAWAIVGTLPAFVAAPDVRPGGYSVRVTAAGYSGEAAVVRLRAGATQRLEVHLEGDPYSPPFWGSWLAYIRDGNVYGLPMSDPLDPRSEELLRPDGDAESVVWLADGRLTYQRAASRDLVLVDLDGGPARVISAPDPTFELRWAAPDGERVLGTISVADADPSGTRFVWAQPAYVDLASGALEPVGAPEMDLGDAAPSWDGGRLVANAPGRAAEGAVAVYDTEARLARRVEADADDRPRVAEGWPDAPEAVGLFERAFLPDDERLLVARWDPELAARVQVIDFKGRVLWEGKRGLYDLRPAADGVHYAATRLGDDGPEVVAGSFGRNDVVLVARGKRPYWSPPPRPR